jgi:adenosylhomocysteinase
MDGYPVMPIAEASKVGDIFITLTGDMSVLDEEHFAAMKDGAIVANSGHFNVEIDIEALEGMTKSKKTLRPYIDEYTLNSGRRIMLIGEGRLVNLAAAEGHPASVMDMSFANQALCAEYLTKGSKASPAVYGVPKEIDREVGRLKLASMGISIDTLTDEQTKYLNSWEMGT